MDLSNDSDDTTILVLGRTLGVTVGVEENRLLAQLDTPRSPMKTHRSQLLSLHNTRSATNTFSRDVERDLPSHACPCSMAGEICASYFTCFTRVARGVAVHPFNLEYTSRGPIIQQIGTVGDLGYVHRTVPKWTTSYPY